MSYKPRWIKYELGSKKAARYGWYVKSAIYINTNMPDIKPFIVPETFNSFLRIPDDEVQRLIKTMSDLINKPNINNTGLDMAIED